MSETVPQPLSPRELEILEAMADGWNNRRIAEAIGISPDTVRAHRTNIRLKLRAHTGAEAVAIGLREGIIS